MFDIFWSVYKGQSWLLPCMYDWEHRHRKKRYWRFFFCSFQFHSIFSTSFWIRTLHGKKVSILIGEAAFCFKIENVEQYNQQSYRNTFHNSRFCSSVLLQHYSCWVLLIGNVSNETSPLWNPSASVSCFVIHTVLDFSAVWKYYCTWFLFAILVY